MSNLKIQGAPNFRRPWWRFRQKFPEFRRCTGCAINCISRHIFKNELQLQLVTFQLKITLLLN